MELVEFLRIIEVNLGNKADVQLSPFPSGYLVETEADIEELVACAGFRPDSPLKQGLNVPFDGV